MKEVIKLKKRIFSAALALCLFISSQSVAHAWQVVLSSQEAILTEESISGLSADDITTLTPTGVYESMIALKEQDAYKEGTTWTDDVPYSSSTGYYRWNGGTLNGTNIVATGCVAFAFILSDEAFGYLPNRMYAKGKFTYEDIKVGDILRVNNDAHTVIVLEKSDVGVVVAEGNYAGKVHWGRAISQEEVMSSVSHYITRYPEGYDWNDPNADEVEKEGTLERDLTWELTKAGALTISGNGSMPDFSSAEEQPWYSYNSQIRKVVIKNGVTNIGNCAFWKTGLLSVEIPSSVTSIGNYAFSESSLINVTIPSSVTTIGNRAFYNCKNLHMASIFDGVKTINQNAFNACSNLTSITLPASIEEVGAAAFFQCTSMVSATFEAGSKQVKLGDDLFSECWYLTDVTLPQSIDCISERMFQNCLMLPGVIIPQGADSIEASAFASCRGMSAIFIPNSVTSIGSAAFSNTSLTDIYYGGTQTEWSGISKSADVTAALSTATIHYEYTLEPTTTPEPTTDPAQTTQPPEETTKPEQPTTPPGQTTRPPEETTKPEQPTTPPGQTTRPPEATTKPEQPTTPPGQTTRPPEATTKPEQPTTPPIQTDRSMGDMDGDGSITLNDAQIALRAVLSIINLTDEEKKALDVDQDGSNTLLDVQKILCAALGIITL